MKKEYFFFLFVLIVSVCKAQDCTFNGKNLFGKVRFVQHANEADVKVKIVNSFPDLKVKMVEHFPDKCGKWQVVEHFEDLKVFVTNEFPDVTIKFVEHFPGKVK